MSFQPINLGTIVLTIDNLDDCMSFISTKAYRWKGIGRMLKLRQDDLNTIDSEQHTTQDKLSEVLSYWLKRKVIAKYSHEMPTWERLIQVMKADRAGSDPAFANRMISQVIEFLQTGKYNHVYTGYELHIFLTFMSIFV